MALRGHINWLLKHNKWCGLTRPPCLLLSMVILDTEKPSMVMLWMIQKSLSVLYSTHILALLKEISCFHGDLSFLCGCDNIEFMMFMYKPRLCPWSLGADSSGQSTPFPCTYTTPNLNCTHTYTNLTSASAHNIACLTCTYTIVICTHRCNICNCSQLPTLSASGKPTP